MEHAVLMTGLTLGGILVFPLAVEWLRKLQFILVGLAVLLVSVYGFAPHSPAARSIVNTINVMPNTFLAAITQTEDGMAKMGSEYFNAFHVR